jgi:hypothetical protein
MPFSTPSEGCSPMRLTTVLLAALLLLAVAL